MKSIEQLTEFPVLPKWRQIEPNSPIDFGTTTIAAIDESPATPVEVRARMVFAPRDRLEILVPSATSMSAAQRHFRIMTSADVELTFVESQDKVRATIAGVEEDTDFFHPLRSPVEVIRRNAQTKQTVFHLVNWPRFSGPDDFTLVTGIAPVRGFKRCGRVFLRVDGWLITIVEIDKIESIIEALRSKGGYVITHVGLIERESHLEYSVDEVDRVLTMLHCYFSFALGRWAGPQLPVGTDVSGAKTFERWGFGPVANGAWHGDASWFDRMHSECLKEVAPGFAELWKNPVWQQPLHDVIYWYVAANHVGDGVNVDSALLFIQSALELLAWTYCVQDRRMVSSSAFGRRGLSAADKLRILVSTLDIPLAIPVEMKALHAKRGDKWVDSMDAITDLRNGLVHPDKSRQPPEDAYYEAWRLLLWYIDMILLRLCGHKGKYGNRLRLRYQNAVDSVPWSVGNESASCDTDSQDWNPAGDYY